MYSIRKNSTGHDSKSLMTQYDVFRCGSWNYCSLDLTRQFFKNKDDFALLTKSQNMFLRVSITANAKHPRQL